jgi:hypothetical protein
MSSYPRTVCIGDFDNPSPNEVKNLEALFGDTSQELHLQQSTISTFEGMRKTQRCGWCNAIDVTKMCAGCGWEKYCNRECQTNDWKNEGVGHKARCPSRKLNKNLVEALVDAYDAIPSRRFAVYLDNQQDVILKAENVTPDTVAIERSLTICLDTLRCDKKRNLRSAHDGIAILILPPCPVGKSVVKFAVVAETASYSTDGVLVY